MHVEWKTRGRAMTRRECTNGIKSKKTKYEEKSNIMRITNRECGRDFSRRKWY